MYHVNYRCLFFAFMWRVSITCCLFSLNVSVQRVFLSMVDSACERRGKAGQRNRPPPERGLHGWGVSKKEKGQMRRGTMHSPLWKSGVWIAKDRKKKGQDDRKGEEMIRKVGKRWGHYFMNGSRSLKLIFSSIKFHFPDNTSLCESHFK